MKNPVNSVRSRKGALVVLFALVLPILIVILGFCIDYANMQRVRNEAQVIADLSSKAAADTLARTGGDRNLAIKAAQDVAAANFIAGKLHSLDPADIIFGRASEQADGSFKFNEGVNPPNSVRVNASRTDSHPNGRVGLFFGRFYGNPTFNLEQTSTASFRDVEVCLVLDRSGSMKWKTTGNTLEVEKEELRCKTPNPQSRWRALDGAIDIFLAEFDATPVQEKVAMVTFASDSTNACKQGIDILSSKLDQTLTTNTDSIRASMDEYNRSIWFGGTNITAGIVEAKNHMIANSSSERDRFIIVLTDGKHNTSDPPFDEATACAAEGIIVHTITFSDEAATEDMEKTATNGGGEHHHATSKAELENIFRRLAGSFAVITE